MNVQDSSGEKKEVSVEQRTAGIKKTLLVLSGKGGVGKSTVAANIAVGLAKAGYNVGLLDIDIHGPSIPGMLGLEGSPVLMNDHAMLPVEFTPNCKVMSIGFLLRESNDAVIWRGPAKYGVIKQFLTEVEWGELDYLVIDSPPGTGDEPLSIAQLLAGRSSAVIVTTPQKVAVDDVRKSISFCKSLNLDIAGIVENMSGFVCPKCGETIDIFDREAGEKLIADTGIPLLARIPVDPTVSKSGDNGKPIVLSGDSSAIQQAFAGLVEALTADKAATK